jgi:hypothetical protein
MVTKAFSVLAIFSFIFYAVVETNKKKKGFLAHLKFMYGSKIKQEKICMILYFVVV